MFGDMNWNSARSWEQERQLQDWLARVRSPLVVELGAGTAVPSVRYFSESLVQGHRAMLIRINPREPDVGKGDQVGFAAGALELLCALDEAMGHPGTC
jgi:hypothetical protein